MNLIPLLFLILPASLPNATQSEDSSERPLELFEVVRVVDGDTIHVQRDGELEKLRLLSVDTEEKFSGGGSSSASKPQTVFGEESALWAKKFFEGLAGEDGKIRVGLRFPRAVETRDVFGRLLCHVILPDGRDFNLMLVELGKSPYFDKYGRSLICHERFVAAQQTARAAQLGVWNPSTNQPAREGAPAAKRPYERLLPWWHARAEAIEDFRRRAGETAPDAAALPVVAADAPDELQLELERASGEVEIFGEIARQFEEQDGSLTVLFRSGDRRRSLRVRIPKEARAAHANLNLAGFSAEFRQNYIYVRGELERGPRGFLMISESLSNWRLAGPQPLPPKDE